jgi:hypothetical protein
MRLKYQMGTSVGKIYALKFILVRLRYQMGICYLAIAHLKKNFVSVELPGMIPGYKFCIPVVNRVVLIWRALT